MFFCLIVCFLINAGMIMSFLSYGIARTVEGTLPKNTAIRKEVARQRNHHGVEIEASDVEIESTEHWYDHWVWFKLSVGIADCLTDIGFIQHIAYIVQQRQHNQAEGMCVFVCVCVCVYCLLLCMCACVWFAMCFV